VTATLTVPGTSTAPALTLRPWLARDIPALIRAHADPAMQRWLLRHIDDADQARATLDEQAAQWAARTRFVFAVVENVPAAPASATPIASVSVRRIAKLPDAAEVGYWTAPEARSRDIATRAVEAAMHWSAAQWAADGDPITRFELIHALGNDASCRVAQKLGFTLAHELPAFPPKFPDPGHLHVRRY
jgi:RimJ/RimL family protein N-acetyltransferase